jgi:tRNA threonylcarbamoyladenosine biosynthesis protein TsaE
MSETMHLSLELADQAATEALAHTLAQRVPAGRLIALTGDLGAGKSTFARAFIRARLQDEEAEVPSPTFTLVQTYDTPDGAEIWHADLYRLSEPEEAYELGLDDARETSVCLIEWPDRMPPDWWQGALELTLEIAGEGRRKATLRADAGMWAGVLGGLSL